MVGIAEEDRIQGIEGATDDRRTLPSYTHSEESQTGLSYDYEASAPDGFYPFSTKDARPVVASAIVGQRAKGGSPDGARSPILKPYPKVEFNAETLSYCYADESIGRKSDIELLHHYDEPFLARANGIDDSLRSKLAHKARIQTKCARLIVIGKGLKQVDLGLHQPSVKTALANIVSGCTGKPPVNHTGYVEKPRLPFGGQVGSPTNPCSANAKLQ